MSRVVGGADTGCVEGVPHDVSLGVIDMCMFFMYILYGVDGVDCSFVDRSIDRFTSRPKTEE